MPVFDIVAFAKSFAKFLLYTGLFVYFITIAGTVISILNSFAGMINTGITAIDALFTSSANAANGLGCLYFMIHALGIDVVLTSFLASAISLLMAWGGATLTLITFKSTLYLRYTVINALR